MATEIVAVDAVRGRSYPPEMTPEQSRAARAWLEWSQQELASAAGVSLSTVRDYEKGRTVPIQATLAAMRTALEAQGIEIVNDGARLGVAGPKRSG